jgi:bifunctional non-homologous end joining protein LigD
MPLTLCPTGLSSHDYRDWLDYVIVADGRAVGRIYEDRHTLPDLRWFWSITVYVDPKRGINTSGRAASLDEAKAQFLSNWQKCRADSTPLGAALYLAPAMSLRPRALPAGFIAPCLPTSAPQPPCGALWLHEIKHDGFRGIARKNGQRVKLYSRPGNDLTPRFALIAEALARLRSRSCIVDGEAVACGDDGIACFELIPRWDTDDRVFIWAFDLIELDGADMRSEPLAQRKASLERVLAPAEPGLRFNEHLDKEDGPLVFHHACKPGLEGIVSKRRDSPYSSGRSRHWVKSKNPNAPAVKREAEEDWGRWKA